MATTEYPFSTDFTVGPSNTTDAFPWMQPQKWTDAGYYTMGFSIGLIGIFGFTGNFVVLLLFIKFKTLRSPTNMFVLGLTISDLAVSIFGNPFSSMSSYAKRWLWGSFMCQWYGFANTFFGFVSIVTLALVALDRYLVICHPSLGHKINIKMAMMMNFFGWIYALGWAVAPFFGWSQYQLEGPGTWCSLLWQSNDTGVLTYISGLFVGVFLIPSAIMSYCYTKLYLTVRAVARQAMSHGGTAKDNEKALKVQKKERQLLMMTVMMCAAYLFAWTPYAIVSLKATFGDPTQVTYLEAAIPSVIAKTATVYNPLIYVSMNEKFRRCLLKMIPLVRVVFPPPEDETRTDSMASTSNTAAVTEVSASGGNKVAPAKA